MSDVNVTSDRQSGGITAQNVNTGSGDQLNIPEQTKEDKGLKTIFWWIFGAIGCIAAAVAIYKHFF